MQTPQYMKTDKSLKGYKRLFVWQKADQLAHQTYLVTKLFPKDEIFGLTSQLRRAVVSVPTNIVEGSAKSSKNELKRFLEIAMGSIVEVEYLLEFSARLQYMTTENFIKLDKLRRDTAGLLWKFHKVL